MSDGSYPPPTGPEFRGLVEKVDHLERTLYGEDDDRGVPRDGLAQIVHRTSGQVEELLELNEAILEQDAAQGRWARVWLLLGAWVAFIQLVTSIVVVALLVRSCGGESEGRSPVGRSSAVAGDRRSEPQAAGGRDRAVEPAH